MKLKRTGTLETVASIVCFSGLIAKTGNTLWMLPMVCFVVLFMAYNGD